MQMPLSQAKQIAMKPWMQIELLMASLIPAAVILVLGVIGSRQLVAGNTGLFLLLILAGATLVFVGEMALLRFTQNATKQPLIELINACQEYNAGNKARRALIGGGDEAATLARLLNQLFDAHAQEQQHVSLYAQNEINQLNEQVRQLIRDVEPVLDGDLRVKAVITSGAVGVLSDVCNYLIEELIQLVKWTRYSADQVIDSTGNLLERSIDLAQTAETQMLRLSQTSEAVERVVAFIQRTSSTLQLGVDITQEMQAYIQEQKSQLLNDGRKTKGPGGQENGGGGLAPTDGLHTFLGKLETETQRQRQLLEGVLQATQGTVSVAESTIGDIYSFAQRINQSSMGILKTAERVSALGGLAEQWRNSVVEFHLPDEHEQNLLQQNEDEDLFVPTPTSPLRKV
jgi:hypothetical protein